MHRLLGRERIDAWPHSRIMAEEADQDPATVLVDGLIDTIGTDLLLLYFESRRRSLGGPIKSHQRHGKCAVLTFEDPDDAQRVLSKELHQLLNVELTVRSVPPRDRAKVVLKGLKPDVRQDVLELYVEYVTNCDSGEYTLHRVPSREEVLIQFHQPLTEAEFSSLEQKVSRRLLEGLPISVERVQRTDQVLVSNLDPEIQPDLLELYFESKRSGGGDVQDVSLLKEARAAIVTFRSWEVADRVLRKPHRLHNCVLQVSPYYAFLHPKESADGEVPAMEEESEPVAESTTSLFIDVMEPWKLDLLRHSSELAELGATFPEVMVQLDQNGVRVSGQGEEQCQQVQGRIVALLKGAAQSHIPYCALILEFVQRNDVRSRLEEMLRRTEPSASYVVAECLLTVTASSVQAVRNASAILKNALCELAVPIPEARYHVLRSQEWQELQASLSCCAVRTMGQDCVQAVCLREYEQENRQLLHSFLHEYRQQDTLITMEPAMLRYLQLYSHELLANMSEVTIEPLEGSDVTGFRILGGAGACQTAEEVIRDIMNGVGTLQVKLEHPGIARFLKEERGQNLLRELETRYRCVLGMGQLCWTPSDNEHEFDAPLLQAGPSFERSCPSTAEVLPETPVTKPTTDLEDIKAIVAAIEDEVDGVTEVRALSETPQAQTQGGTFDDLYKEEPQDEIDLYRDPSRPDLYSDPSRPAPESDEENSEDFSRRKVREDSPFPLSLDEEVINISDDEDRELNKAKQMSLVSLSNGSNIDEKANMHLAIQRSMDIMSQSAENEERDLKAALEYSLLSYREEQKHDLYQDDVFYTAVDNLEAALEVSMEDMIRAANYAQVTIYGGYNTNLQLIADQLHQAVKAKLNTEMVENSCLRKLPEKYHLYLTHLQRKHAVQISVQGAVATIHGFMEHTIYASRDVTKLINRLLQEEQLKLEEAEVSKEVSWVWYDLHGKEVPFSRKANAFIEHAWRQKQRRLDIVFDNQPYTIDFEKMEEYNIGASESTRIARIETSSRGAEAGIAEVQDNKVELVKVDEASEEFRKVIRTFYDTLEAYHSKIKIVKLEKLVNPLLHSQYHLKKLSMERAGCREPVERMLYHGTSAASAKEICQYGFNRSFCGKNATRYGQGVYFAVQSVLSVLDFYSPRNTEGNKCVFVVKTLTGDYTTGTQDMKVPPIKDTTGPIRYDSLVDDVKNPTIFVIFNDTQAYPQYLITCRKN
ncbi:protein mono-ADP-ribosyltransferase PARP10 isoform X1 [Pleurodeles waltl]|uniref:protein mono-ADP-ribosyltransferase PARP10 isoform X1 n=2 Tax=Pleurodeles waltl TaxID=8319 RepID=UPI0037095DD5